MKRMKRMKRGELSNEFIEDATEEYSPPELKAASDEELELWKEIERADKPIRNILKRLNRIVQKQFPLLHIKTSDSCSGHVRLDGQLDYAEDKLETMTVRREYKPSIIFSTDANDAKDRAKIDSYLRTIFKSAVKKTNEKYGSSGTAIAMRDVWIPDEAFESTQGGEIKDIYNIAYSFNILQQERAIEVLQVFWEAIENELTSIDNIQTHTQFLEKSFRH